MAETSDKARQYKRTTIRRLDTFSANQCAEPSCNKTLVAEDGISIVSKICHIEAASEKGPRYNSNMTDDDRRSFDNLILLCDEHHTIIDNKENELKYPVSLLKEWKNKHESKSIISTIESQPLSKNPLALNKVINAIANSLGNFEDVTDAGKAPNTETKISYNNIIKYAPIIKEMSLYQGQLSKIYTEIENQGSVKKFIILNGLRQIYLEVKGNYSTLDEIQKNADVILDQIIDKTLEKIVNSSNHTIELDSETINFSLLIVVVDAFIRCKILEEPSYDS